MPDLSFVLPHWLYWSGVLIFPIVAMILVRRYRRKTKSDAVNLPLAYMLWLTGGFVGLHRFYLRSWLGVFYLPLFFGILFANADGRGSREMRSLADSDVMILEFDLERSQKALDEGKEGAQDQLQAVLAKLQMARERFSEADASMIGSAKLAENLAIVIAILLLVDATILPRLTRLQNEREKYYVPPNVEASSGESVAENSSAPSSSLFVVDKIEWASRVSGEFVAYWSVIAVFVYYYEVVARYVFNSPTNWAHEAMFLMFGMQYLISGAYAYLTDGHVRVDVFYARLSVKRKAITDLLTSVFFFIFAGTLLGTGYIFFSDSIGVWEVSFTEWAIQYWPVKATIILGAVLILFQGIAKVTKDVQLLLSRNGG